MREGEPPALLKDPQGSSLDEIIVLDELVMAVPKPGTLGDAWCAVPNVINIGGNWNLIPDVFVCGYAPTRPTLDEWVQKSCVDSKSAWGGYMFHDDKVYYRRGLGLRLELTAPEGEGLWRVYLRYDHIIGSRFLGYAKPEVDLFKERIQHADQPG